MNHVVTKIIQRKNNITLVEWIDGQTPRRAWITPDMIVSESGTEATIDHPEAGIPYGVDFSRMVVLSTTPEDIDREFKRRGIWTIADLRAKSNEAVGAIQAAYRIDLGRVLQAAKLYEDELEGRGGAAS